MQYVLLTSRAAFVIFSALVAIIVLGLILVPKEILAAFDRANVKVILGLTGLALAAVVLYLINRQAQPLPSDRKIVLMGITFVLAAGSVLVGGPLITAFAANIAVAATGDVSIAVSFQRATTSSVLSFIVAVIAFLIMYRLYRLAP